MEYKATIGLEIHAQLSTNTKMFCSCSTKFGNKPNSQVCPICLGLPGTLPTINKKAVEYAVKLGLATNCKIRNKSTFARKNYFYPDLPKGYQITQYEEPICYDGFLEIDIENNQKKKIRIKRIHLEEDAGKSIHYEDFVDTNRSLVDLNRAGVPLVEIVTEPDIENVDEAYSFLMKIKQLLEYIEISDANMEKGNLRCDANVSVAPINSEKFGVKTEVKNMNSFRGIQRALNYEINRQIEILKNGGKIVQETLFWDEAEQKTKSMRSKEEANDYRYFPEPDLVILNVSKEWENEIKNSIPELPEEKFIRFLNEYNLTKYDIDILLSDKNISDYFEKIAKLVKNYKAAANFVITEILRILNDEKISINEFKIPPENIAELLNLIDKGIISSRISKQVFEEMLATNEKAETIISKNGLMQISNNNEIEKFVEKVLNENKDEVNRYKNGEVRLKGFFIGEIMKLSDGKANPKLVNEILSQKLEEK